jgi:ATP synthase F1 delta subunit
MIKNPSIDNRLAKKYAKALLASCDSKKEQGLIKSDVEALQGFLLIETSLLRRISSPYVPDEVFTKILTVLATEFKLQEKSVSFFRVLQKNNRTNLISKSMESYIRQYHEEHGIIKVRVIANKDFTRDELARISDVITAKYKKEVVFDLEKDSNIIAGFVLKINDSITIDCSVNKYLETLRGELEAQLENID